MRILVTMSRDWRDDVSLFSMLGYTTEIAPADDLIVIVHGDQERERFFVEKYVRIAQAMGRISHEPHPADWSTGRAAGLIRNKTMVDLGADLCLAFIMPCTKNTCVGPVAFKAPHGSHGATDCRNKALVAGIRTISDERWK